jgi:hypothetical protein
VLSKLGPATAIEPLAGEILTDLLDDLEEDLGAWDPDTAPDCETRSPQASWHWRASITTTALGAPVATPVVPLFRRLGFQDADEAREAESQACPLGRVKAIEQHRVGLLEGAADLPGDLAALRGELESVEAPVGGVPLAGDPALTFQVGGEATDRALLEAEPFSELLLRQSSGLAELAEREHLRQGELMVPAFVRSQQAACPYDEPEEAADVVIREIALSCVMQLSHLCSELFATTV